MTTLDKAITFALATDTSTILLRGVDRMERSAFFKDFYRVVACEKGEACGECASCKAAEAGHLHHALILDKPGTLGVDDVRNFLVRVRRKPPKGCKRRVVAIFDAESLTIPAQNALLKVLEDGSERTTFVLSVGDEGALMPTIRSRSLWISVDAAYWEVPRIVSEDVKTLFFQWWGAKTYSGLLNVGRSAMESVDLPTMVNGFKILLEDWMTFRVTGESSNINEEFGPSASDGLIYSVYTAICRRARVPHLPNVDRRMSYDGVLFQRILVKD